jgi:CO/xanthine dehydrogenase FAD-binding subunit
LSANPGYVGRIGTYRTTLYCSDGVRAASGDTSVQFVRPTTFADALAEKAAQPDAVPILGGTDLMVGLNAGRRPPPVLLDLSAVEELRSFVTDGATIRIGAGMTYALIIDELGRLCPGLAAAARTVGSPQIRNRATLAGNLGTASPAGDTHPVLIAARAVVAVESVRGPREIPIDEFYLGPKRNALAPDELIAAVRMPIAAGPQQFAKVGPRNAMVIAVCSIAVVLDARARTVGVGIGSAAPTPRRVPGAEALARELPWRRGELGADVARRFGDAVSAAATPIDDVRGTAAYRRHALAVLARRTLAWAVSELPGGGR